MINIKIETQVPQNLNKLARSLAFKGPLKTSVKLLEKEAQQNFDQQGRIYGNWKPLAQSTRKQRVRQGCGAARPILIRSGKLKKGYRTSATQKVGEIENTVHYAKYHQHGTRKMPRRIILGTSGKSKMAIGLIFANFIGYNIKKYLG